VNDASIKMPGINHSSRDGVTTLFGATGTPVRLRLQNLRHIRSIDQLLRRSRTHSSAIRDLVGRGDVVARRGSFGAAGDYARPITSSAASWVEEASSPALIRVHSTFSVRRFS